MHNMRETVDVEFINVSDVYCWTPQIIWLCEEFTDLNLKPPELSHTHQSRPNSYQTCLRFQNLDDCIGSFRAGPQEPAREASQSSWW